ncbi:hypothetical protein HBI81_192430 [Parastagonospora nodorum]|nr:hypothetical protein HBH52_191340 [Parastagonospora nodorum]KAH4019274.1 hypothetical protein HBI09_187250 [Parastagonospora nodorum]KAH4994431.1 hypothetical protein HBI77_208680 [Parastagonospora nodorum]KAH6516274.1 hypothetical protein HBI81_192430 [Parastagonospora nodorum]
MLIVFRFVAGCFGGAPVAIGGGAVSDMYPPGQRPRLMAWYSVGTMMSPNVGLVLGGMITGGLGGDGYSRSLLPCPTTVNWRRQNFALIIGRSLSIPAIITSQSPCLAIILLSTFYNGLINMILSSLGSVFQSSPERQTNPGAQRGVFKDFVGDNTGGTGSDTNGKTTIYKADYWIPTSKEIDVGDGKTSFCNLKSKRGKTGTACFKTFKDGAVMNFCDKVFERSNLDTLKANECAKIGDQVSTKRWAKNFIGANVLHEFMHNPRIGREAVLKKIKNFAYDAYQCHQLAIDGDIEKRKTTINNADT